MRQADRVATGPTTAGACVDSGTAEKIMAVPARDEDKLV